VRLNYLTASFPEFRTVTFKDGLNIVVAERTKEATRTDSRNGLGKTSVLALLDFCLGANVSERIELMQGQLWSFTLSVTTRSGITLLVSRSPDASKEIVIAGDVVSAGIVLREDAPTDGELTIGVRKWTDWLKIESFGHQASKEGTPSFRALFRHFVRYRADALLSPFRTVANQGAEFVQAENAYLLHLDWRLAKEWAQHKEKAARIALADDPESDINSRIAALEPQLVRTQRRVAKLTEEVTRFSVLPEYREIEARLQDITARVKTIGNDNFVNRQRLHIYEAQPNTTSTLTETEMLQLFTEVGIIFSDAVVRTLEEALEFQAQVAANRSAYLADETRRLQARIAEKEAEQKALSDQQEEYLEQLRQGGALNDLVVLQGSLAEAQVSVAQLHDQIATLRELDIRKADLKSKELDLVSRSKQDVQERLELRAEIVTRFGDIVEALYGEPADLLILPGKGGVQFKVKLPRVGSDGVLLMSIFAYDIAIVEDYSRNQSGPGFLLHDSSIFADVDERQTAKAIEIAASSAVDNGYQHLITINSDKVPWGEFSDKALYTDSVVLSLHDGDATGSLLGQRLQSKVAGENPLPI
jgi:uncharacterized protein YydD (DUF2326 family)